VLILTALVLPFAAVIAPARAGAASRTVTINVDHNPPAGNQTFGYTDFFPRDDVRVHAGDVVHFQFSGPGTPHTATLLASGEAPLDAWTQLHPNVIRDSDDGPNQRALSVANFFPTNVARFIGGPGACGDANDPCAYDGHAELSSGVVEIFGAHDFSAR